MLLSAPPASAATGIVAVGDFGVGGARQRTTGAAIRSFVERNETQLLVTLGDNDYSERPGSFADAWRASFGWLPAASVGVAGSLGNHDVRVDRGRYQFGLLGMPGPYYVRRLAEVELIVLDSNAATAPAQTRWLRRSLSRRTGLHRVAVFHHPAYSCGTYAGNGAIQRRWVPLFERFGVRLVLNAHDHNYQRFVRNGVSYVVHGGGGARLYPLRRCRAGYPRRVAARSTYGFLHVSVLPDGLLVRSVDLTGKVIDRFSVTP